MARAGGEDPVDTDAAFREALSQESAEVLRHQISAERAASVRMHRGEVILSALLAGFGAGVGWAGASGWIRRRGRRRR